MISNSFAVVNLDNLKNNYDEIVKFIDNKDVTVMPVIKGNAYGHGALEVAKFFEENGCDYFGVSSLKEAYELRENSIKTPILVLSTAELEYIDYVVDNNITISLFSYEYAKVVSEICEKLNKKCKVHIKIDTGMSRVGMVYKTAFEEVQKVCALPNLEVEGIYTHFASADVEDFEFTEIQFSRFSELLEKLKSCNIDFKYKHCCNSSAILRGKDLGMHLNMVRTGLCLYGQYPSEYVSENLINIKPVMSLKAKVIDIREIESGEGVSYGQTFVADKRTVVATISVGYGDGLPRNIGTIASLEVQGERVKILGRVCMDKCMLDITDIEDKVSIGDEVTVFGGLVTVDELAKISGNSNYEILTRILGRVDRIYK